MSLAEEALSLIPYQFNDSPKLRGLIRSLIEPFEGAHNELQRLHHGRYIDEASGMDLDVIGNIVGQDRLGMADDDYKAWIKVAISLNNSSGTVENILNIISILFGKKPPVRMEEYAPNDVILTFFEYPKFPQKTLFTIIKKAAPITTKCQFLRADPTPRKKTTYHIKNSERSAFRFDYTDFSNSYFADFFEGEAHE